MSGVITTGNLPRLLQQGVRAVFDSTYNEHESQYTRIFDVTQSKKAFELDVQFDGFGLAPVKPEGAGIQYDSQSQGYVPKYQNLTYAKGFIVSREALEDELYDVFSKKAKALAFAMRQTKENVGANVLNRGFNSSYTMTGGDGVELFSTAHVRGPNDTSTYSNMLAVASALSETAIEQLLIQINEATDARGLRIQLMGQRLIVPPALCFEAERIMNSVLQNDTANNAVNALKSKGMLPDGYSVNNYLTSSTAWFIKTDCQQGMIWQDRQAVRFEQDNDFGTSDSRFKADERYACGWSNPRGAYASAGV
jgi:phage major head subunit gpT-like protein